tara:strand:+ start:44 stop:205 length:162 start_codon:yes stop_codon:yes gene_type:complete
MNLPIEFVDAMNKVSMLVPPDDDELFESLYNLWNIAEYIFQNISSVSFKHNFS